jgi:hypothetical protein
MMTVMTLKIVVMMQIMVMMMMMMMMPTTSTTMIMMMILEHGNTQASSISAPIKAAARKSLSTKAAQRQGSIASVTLLCSSNIRPPRAASADALQTAIAARNLPPSHQTFALS